MTNTSMSDGSVLGMSVSDACKRWGISRPTMYRLLADPSCPAFRVGRKWIIPIEAFDEWMMDKADERAEITEAGGDTFGDL